MYPQPTIILMTSSPRPDLPHASNPQSPCDFSKPAKQISRFPNINFQHTDREILLTLTSQNPALSSKFLYGLRPPPSRSIWPAHALCVIGFSFSVPSTSPIDTKTTETKASIVTSGGKRPRGLLDTTVECATLLESVVCSWAE
jgi:hypothetical protein